MKKEKPLVIFAPNWSKNNPYQNMLAESIGNKYQVIMEDFEEGFTPFTSFHKTHPSMKVLHLHWIAELIHRLSWSKSSIVFYIKLYLLCFDLIRLQKRGVKVVWTIHNKLSHQGLNIKRELTIRRLFCRLVDTVILHSTEAKNFISEFYNYPLDKKAKVIFHGNYEGSYPVASQNRESLREKFNIMSNESLILYFGSIRQYKGVENLIRCFKQIEYTQNLKLILAGGVANKDYKEELLNIIDHHTQIDPHFYFIADQDLVDLIEASDLVVLPFADTLTSGSTILAMTIGKALILSEPAKIFGCVPDSGVRYFSNNEDLKNILSQVEALPLKEMGHANRDASKLLSWAKVGVMIDGCYTEK